MKFSSRKLLAAAIVAAFAAPAVAADGNVPTTVRFATFNASLNRDALGQLLSDKIRFSKGYVNAAG